MGPKFIRKPTDIEVLMGTIRLVETYSCFGSLELGEDTGLLPKLRQRNVTKVYCCGIATDYCVGETALDSAKNGFETYVLLDCCAYVNPETEQNMKARLEEAGV